MFATDWVATPVGVWLRYGAFRVRAKREMSEMNREVQTSEAAVFSTTHWSVVLAAGEVASPSKKEEALEQLCRRYWKPLYAWLRRSQPGLAPRDAQDHIQSFFADMLERMALAKADRAKGRFRSFLLASLKHHLQNDLARAKAQKRGGRFEFVSWDDPQLEEAFLHATSPALPPDRAFEQAWALALLEQVLARLKAEHSTAGKAAQFEALQVYLNGDKGAVPYAETAARLGLGESAVKMAIQRLRRRFGELLREEIAHTVARPEEVDEEIRALFAAVGG